MKSTRERLRWFLVYWISRTGIAAGRFLPPSFCYKVSGPIADVCFRIMTRHRRNLIANLTRVVGAAEAPDTARRVFRSFARYAIDLYQMPSRGRDALQRRLVFADWQQLDQALDAPDGTLFVTLHLGEIELGAAAVAAYGHSVNVVAESLAHRPMDELIQGLRAGLGIKVMKANKARLDVVRCLNRGEVLVMMFDAVQPGQGTVVDFYGAPAEMAGVPARIALRTGARLLPAVIASENGRLVPVVDFGVGFTPTGDEEADVQALTQLLARSFERIIRRFPDQWFAFRPIWETSSERNTSAQASEAWKVWALRAAIGVGGYLPRRIAYGLARLAGDAAFFARRRVRLDVEDNMRHVMVQSASDEDVKESAREVFRSVARYYVDLIQLARRRPEELMQRVTLHGIDKLTALLDAGRGVVVASAHFGNPEIAAQVGAVLGLNMLVLAEPLDPPALSRMMKQIRAAYAPRYEDVGFHGIAEAIRHLRAGGGVAIACDRDVQSSGVPLEFFGVPASLPLGAVDMAARTNAVVMPACCRREGDGFGIYFEEPLEMVNTGRPREDALVNARTLLARAEQWIRQDPGQWMVLERIWKPLRAAPSRRKELKLISDDRLAPAEARLRD